MMLLPPSIPDLFKAAAVAVGNVPNQEKPKHAMYLQDFRTQQCTMFLEHKCQFHRPYTCFNWHFPNQKRRRPIKKLDGTFNYNPDVYCTKYDENSGVCPSGEDCPYVHRNAGDTERRYHPRYFKTGNCIYETTDTGACVKNGQHCAFAHGPDDIRLPVYDIREVQDAAQRSVNLPASLEKERVLSEDPQWNDMQHVLAFYKTEQCKKPPRMCRQGYACPFFHNGKDKRRNPKIHPYRSTPCPQVKPGDEWRDSSQCETGDDCTYCHTRTEQQFHPEIYKSTKCNDTIHSGYCPRGPFCAFAHIETEMAIGRDFMANSEFSLSSDLESSGQSGNSNTTDCSNIWSKPVSSFDQQPLRKFSNLNTDISSMEDNDCPLPVLSPIVQTPTMISTIPNFLGISGSLLNSQSFWSTSSSSTCGQSQTTCSSSNASHMGPPCKGRHFSGGSLSSESGLSSSSARGDTPPYYMGLDSTLCNWNNRNMRNQGPHKPNFSSGFGRNATNSPFNKDWLSEDTQRSIIGNPAGDCYNINQRDLCEPESWLDEYSSGSNCGSIAASDFDLDSKSLNSTLRSAPVSIPRQSPIQDRPGSHGSSGLGSFPHPNGFPSRPGFPLDQSSLSSTGFTPSSCKTFGHTESSSPNNLTNMAQSPIMSNSPFSNATRDLERLALQKELDEYRNQLKSKKYELNSTKKERDMAMFQLQESMHVIRSLVHHLGTQQSTTTSSPPKQVDALPVADANNQSMIANILMEALKKTDISESTTLLKELQQEISQTQPLNTIATTTSTSGTTTPVSNGQQQQ